MVRHHDIRSLSDFEARFRQLPGTLAPIHLADMALSRQFAPPFGQLPLGGLAMRQVERVID